MVDIQNDFCPGGALAVHHGDEVVPLANRLSEVFGHTVLTQDWHPPHHQSFASSHAGHEPFQTFAASYGAQTLWPDHCVQGTIGAQFHPSLEVDRAELILRKGFRTMIDSYSAFLENDRTTPTGLAGYLRDCDMRRIFISGLALDYCVRYSAEDGCALDFQTFVIEDACRGIETGKSLNDALAAMRACGVQFATSDELI